MSDSNLKFRHEIKYLINECDKEIIRQKISPVLALDEHTNNRQYHVRSLYFDDYSGSAYDDKINGHLVRKKYRVRVYDYNSNQIKLECKFKRDAYIHKVSAPLTKEEYYKIINNDFDFLLRREENLCKQFYFECVSRVMRPKVIVDYEREPYILEAGDVRITFDKNIRGISPWFDIFDDNLPSRHALEPGKLVMELKFTEFLPEIVKNSLASRSIEMSAVSKYVICSEKLNYLTAKLY